jgi:Cellulase (glycosyl hydrolase family 5)
LKKVRKNKRAIFLGAIAFFFVFALLIVHNLYPYVGMNLLLNTFTFSPSVTDNTQIFYGENIDMSQILPTSQYYFVNSKGQDLIDIAASLGINLIRITNIQRSFNNQAASVYTGDQWKIVLRKMQSKGIKALILIETASNNKNYSSPDIRPAYLQLVQKYIDSGVFSNTDVYGVDIRNEPLLTDDNITMLQAAHTMIKAKYPHMKQTIGWWASPKTSETSYKPNNYDWSDFARGQKIANIVDFYSIHMYGLDTANFGINLDPRLKTKVFVSQVENGLQTKKPILIEEFGEANGDAVSDQNTIGNPQLQANIYQGVYQALKEMHSSQLIGSVAFDFYSRNQRPDAWAIVKNKGNYLFPAAYILQEYALRKNNPSLQTATVVTSQSYLVKNSENNVIKNLHISDRIGLKLRLNNSENYIVSLSVRGKLQPIESLQYNPVSNSYDAVYQAVAKGSIRIKILSHSIYPIFNLDPSIVYILTINIY